MNEAGDVLGSSGGDGGGARMSRGEIEMKKWDRLA